MDAAWLQGVAERLLMPGTLLVIFGAVIACLGRPIGKILCTSDPERGRLIAKAMGCGIALLGAVLLFAVD
ncbi:MAG: hypothetical protein IJ246_09965 [Clostridia bacterium]|nr:hypothetical protein [Clostridia bacterium]